MTDREQGELEDFMDQGGYVSDGSYASGEASVDTNKSVVSETYPPELYLELSENSMSQHNTGPVYGNAIGYSFPVLSIIPPASVISSDGFLGTASSCNVAIPGNSGGSGLCSMRKPHVAEHCGRKNLFDATQVSFHLRRNDQDSEESLPTVEDNPLNSGAIPGYLFSHLSRTTEGPKVSDIDNGQFSLPHERSYASSKTPRWSCNHYNRIIVSPFLKAAASPGYGSPEVSEPASPEHDSECEEFSCMNCEGAQMFLNMGYCHSESLSKKCTKDTTPDISYLAGENAQPLFEKWATAEHDMNVHSPISSKSCSPSIHHESSKENFLHDKFMSNCSSEPDWLLQSSFEEGKLMSKESLQVGGDELKMGNNMRHTSCDFSFEKSSPSVPHGFASSHPLKEALRMLSKGHGTEAKSTINAHLVVTAIQNLSELLLLNTSVGLWKLKDEDYEVLKNMMANLHASLRIFQQDSSRLESESSQQVPSQVYGKAPVVQSSRSEEEKKHFIVPGHSDTRSSKLSIGHPLNPVRDSKMAQAIKNILMENFHEEMEPNPEVQIFKNLWLEAEAILCSTSCRARYNHMKSEMEKLEALNGEGSSEISGDQEKLSSLKPSSILIRDCLSVPGAAPLYGMDQNMTTKSLSAMSANDGTNDLIARFNNLKHWETNSCAMDARDSVEQTSSKGCFSHDLEEAGEQLLKACEAVDGLMQDIPHNFPTCLDDDPDASVMSRLSILRKWDDILGSANNGKMPVYGINQNITTESLSSMSVNNSTNDLMARLNILKGRETNSYALDARDGVQQASSKGYSSRDLEEAELPLRACEAVDGLMQYIRHNFSTCLEDDVDASVTARLSILRERDDILGSVNGEKMPICGMNQITTSESSPAMSANDGVNDLVARFNILEGRETNSYVVDAGESVEQESSKGCFSHDIEEADELPLKAREAVDGLMPDIPHNFLTRREDGVEASVMSRLSVLRKQDNSLSSVNGEKMTPGAVYLRSSVMEDYFAVLADKTDAQRFSFVGHASVHQAANCGDGVLTSNADRALSENEEVPNSEKTDGSARTTSAGHNDSPSSSEWDLCMGGGGD